MVGTIFRLPDAVQLVRGITFTILPDGRSLRVPTMNRNEVRAQSQGHEEDQDKKIMQALQDVLSGKKPVAGRAAFGRRGKAKTIQRVGQRQRPEQLAPVEGAGLRPMPMEGGQGLAEF